MLSNDSRLRSGNCAGNQQALRADADEFVPVLVSPECSPSFIAKLLGQPTETDQGKRIPGPTRTANAHLLQQELSSRQSLAGNFAYKVTSHSMPSRFSTLLPSNVKAAHSRPCNLPQQC